MEDIEYDKIDNTPLPVHPEECEDTEAYLQDTLADILKEIKPLKHRASHLSTSLRIKPSALATQPPSLDDVIRAWLNLHYLVARHGPPTWRLLIKAVADDSGGANKSLAKMMAKKHPVGSTVVPDAFSKTTVEPKQESGGDPPSQPLKSERSMSTSSTTSSLGSQLSSQLSSQISTPTQISEESSIQSVPPFFPSTTSTTPSSTTDTSGTYNKQYSTPSCESKEDTSSMISGKEENRVDDNKPDGPNIGTTGLYGQPPDEVQPSNPTPISNDASLQTLHRPEVPSNVLPHDPGRHTEAEPLGHVPSQAKYPGYIPAPLEPPVNVPVQTTEAVGPSNSGDHVDSKSVVEDDGLFGVFRRDRPAGDSSASREDLPVPLQPYKMSKANGYHGYALIINNINISGRDKRQGAEKDDENLSKTLNTLGYKLFGGRYYRDYTAKQMTELFKKVTMETDHTQYDSFVCCLLSHGDAGKIYGSDDRAVKLEDIKNDIINCRSLVGKPKIFIIQSCRGGHLPEAHAVEVDDHENTGRILLPQESDLFFGYATTENTKACRFTDTGSWYIIELCDILTKYHKEVDLLQMVQYAHLQVAQKDEYVYERNERSKDGKMITKTYKQSPQMVSTLVRPVYF